MKTAQSFLLLLDPYTCPHIFMLMYREEDMTALVIVLPEEPNVSLWLQRDVQDYKRTPSKIKRCLTGAFLRTLQKYLYYNTLTDKLK